MSRAGWLGLLMLSGSLLFAAEANAATVGGVFGTGVNDVGGKLAVGSTDTHYSVTLPTPGVSTVIVNGFYATAPDAQFITYTPSANVIGLTTYSTTFSLTGYNAATASLTGNVAVDDGVTIYLNGNPIFATQNVTSASNYNSLTQFSAGAGSFVAGTNALTFQVYNGGGPTGFLVSNLQVTALGVPGPVAGASLPVLAGMLGFWFLRRGQGQRVTEAA